MIMNAEEKKYQPSTKTGIALLYNVSVVVFNGWVAINKDLQMIMKPYEKRKAVIPPKDVRRIIEILGEP